MWETRHLGVCRFFFKGFSLWSIKYLLWQTYMLSFNLLHSQPLNINVYLLLYMKTHKTTQAEKLHILLASDSYLLKWISVNLIASLHCVLVCSEQTDQTQCIFSLAVCARRIFWVACLTIRNHHPSSAVRHRILLSRNCSLNIVVLVIFSPHEWRG